MRPVPSIALAFSAGLTLLSGQAWAEEQFDLGKQVFQELAQPSCSVCHVLEDAGAVGPIGPNLDELAPSEEQVIRAVTGGVGVMPAFAASLSEEQIAAVAHYVASVTGAASVTGKK